MNFNKTTAIQYKSSRLLPTAGEAKPLPLNENAVFYQQLYFQVLPELMPTNLGSLFMGLHPPSSAKGAEAVLAAGGITENLEECISYKKNDYIQAENTVLLVATNNLLVSENCLSTYKK